MTNASVKPENIALLSFDEAFEKVNKLILQKLSSSPSIVRQYTLYLTASRGKFIRAVSLLTCAMDAENRINPDAVLIAAGIELLHLATLVHDDVIDDAETRRGVASLQKKFGRRTAVICGDYILCLALETVTACKRTKESLDFPISTYLTRLCMGELSQHINNGNLNLSIYRYLKIISGKTAALFEASFFGGAILLDKDSKTISQYQKLGQYLGMIYQLTDDCNDYEIEKSEAAKPVQSDFEQGVITLPLIYTMQNKTGLREQLASGTLNDSELNQCVLENNGPSFAHMVSEKYYKKALSLLDKLTLSDEKRSRLTFLFDKSCSWK
ncbi:MAG: polyprenyl synthetase family protein [Oscillospiraceae bacterium]|nr:polyprenyl synthetase family protein [Oscillospiraceae bacterium]